MVAPGLLVLVATTTFPLLYLLWQSLQNINLAMPGMDRYIGVGNYVRMWEDSRFWGALSYTGIYTGVTVVLQLVIGLGMAMLVLRIPRAGLCRGDPIKLGAGRDTTEKVRQAVLVGDEVLLERLH